MTDEYIYDRQRIFMVLLVLAIVVGSGVIMVLAWPRAPPTIGQVSTNVTVEGDEATIADIYEDFFVGLIDTNNTVLYKIDVFARRLYFITGITLTLQVSELVNIVGVVMTEYNNPENIVFGQNDIPTSQKVYVKDLDMNPTDVTLYVFFDIFEEAYTIGYNVVVSE